MSILRSLERRGSERRGADPRAEWGNSAPPPPGSIGSEAAGTRITEKTALQLAAVYGSVSLISDSIATLPIQQYRLVAGEAVKMESASVIAQPWAEFSQRDFITQGTMSMLLRGNLWGRVVSRDQDVFPSQVQLVHPDHATVRRLATGELQFRYWNQVVPAATVTRKMALSLPEGLVGLNPIEYMRNTMGLARAQDLWGGAFYANSARPDGYISVPDDYDDDEAKAAGEAWKAAHQGINHAHLPAILTGGAKWVPVTMTMADAQFLQQMQFSEGVISGRIYRVPPHMLGMIDKTTSWGAGVEQQELGFVRNTLLVWLSRWEDLLSSWLPPGQFVAFDLSQRLRGDTLQRWSAWQIARVVGAMSNAEIRAAEGLPKVTDPAAATVLDDFAAPLNSAPVKPTSTGGAGGDKAD